MKETETEERKKFVSIYLRLWIMKCEWITLLNMDEFCKADLRKGGRLESESPQDRIPNWQIRETKRKLRKG